jgi:hypothetical protein
MSNARAKFWLSSGLVLEGLYRLSGHCLTGQCVDRAREPLPGGLYTDETVSGLDRSVWEPLEAEGYGFHFVESDQWRH